MDKSKAWKAARVMIFAGYLTPLVASVFQYYITSKVPKDVKVWVMERGVPGGMSGNDTRTNIFYFWATGGKRMQIPNNRELDVLKLGFVNDENKMIDIYGLPQKRLGSSADDERDTSPFEFELSQKSGTDYKISILPGSKRAP